MNSLPFYHPSILPFYHHINPYRFYLYISTSIPLSILSLYPAQTYHSIYSISISTSITLSILSLSPHLSLYLFYLYLHIYHSIYSISISTSITLSILSLSPHISLYLFYLYLHIYHSIYSISISTSITLSILSLSPHLSLYLFYLYLHIFHSIYSISISTSITLPILSLSPHLTFYPFYLYLHIYPYMSDIFTVLSWWRVNRNKYPVLSQLARFHSCPPGSAASEHLFSTAKKVAWTKRLSLKSENLERLLFFKFNLRSTNGEKRTPTTDFEAHNSHILSPPAVSDTVNSGDETSDIEIVSDTEGDEEM